MMRDLDQQIRENLPASNRIMAPFMWYGSKARLAKWILPHIPKTKMYVEPFAGTSSLLFHREPTPIEVLNDLHSEIVCLFRVLQNKTQFHELAHRLTFTLYSREEFRLALKMEKEEGHTELDRAWAFFVRQNMGFSGTAIRDGNWGRSFITNRGMADTCSQWRSRLHLLEWWHDRLSRVQIDNVCALKCIDFWDSKETCFYIDPPYVMDTRVGGEMYKHEINDTFHSKMVEKLLSVLAQCVLSGYEHNVYQPLIDDGWKVFKRDTFANSSNVGRNPSRREIRERKDDAKRTEILYVKSNVSQSMLF